MSPKSTTPSLKSSPSHWPMVPIKHVSWINAEALGESSDPDRTIRYVDISSVNSLGQIVDIETMPFGKAPSRARRVVRHGDTIVSTVRTYLRAVAPIPVDDNNLIVSTGFAVISPDQSRIDPRFASFWLRSSPFIDEVCARSVGVSYPALNASEVGSLPIPVPPLPTQKAIADFLDRKTAAIDRLIEKKQKLLTLLAEKRAALINQAVTKGLDPTVPMKDSGIPWIGEIPAHWGLLRVCHAVKISNANRLPISRAERSEMQGEYPYWGPTGVLDQVDEYRYDGSYALIGEDGDHFTKFRRWSMTQWAEGRFNVNNHAHVVASGRRCSARWFYWAFRHRDIGGDLVAQGVARLKLTRWALSNLWLPVPGSPEQADVVAFLDKAVAADSATVSALKGQLSKLQEYRQALITAAVTGQLDIGEAA